MAILLADLHSFIIYSYVGTAVILGLSYILLKMLKITAPRLKAQLYFSALIISPLTYFIAHVILRKPCQFGVAPFSSHLNDTYNLLCTAGSKIAEYLVPFFGVALFVGLAKAVISIIACRKLITDYGFLDESEAPDLFVTLRKIADEIGVAVPKIILTPEEQIRAFTFGVKEPVVVLSYGTLNNLNEQELKHVIKHEFAHIQRNDIFTNWFAVMIRDISFFNPFAHIAFYRYVAAKEEASDDLAIETGLNPYEYGTTLIKMWKLSKTSSFTNFLFNNISPNPGFLKRAATFEARVARMLSWSENNNNSKYFKLFMVLLIVISISALIIIC